MSSEVDLSGSLTILRKEMTKKENINKMKLSEIRHKVIVVDTSSLLMSGTKLLDTVTDCEIVLPSIVISELENLRADQSVGIFAREWLRLLEDLRKDYGTELTKGVELKDHSCVTLRIEPNHTQQKSLPVHLQNGSNDSTVLSVAKNLFNELSGYKKNNNVIVVLSNDVPMRLHSTIDLKIPSVAFDSNDITETKAWDGVEKVSISNNEYGKTFVGDKEYYFDLISNKVSNDINREIVDIFVDDSHIDYWIYEKSEKNLEKVSKSSISGITGKSMEQNAALYYLSQPFEKTTVVSLGGDAGTGKTLLAIAAGLSEIDKNNYQKIVVLKSLHEMGIGQEMGFLPGDIDDKMEPWAASIRDAIEAIVGEKTRENSKTKALAKKMWDKIDINPITYLRGRSINNSWIIIEEAQNFSRSELLNIITRCGKNSKIVLTFDPSQVDNRFLKSGDSADVWSVVNDLSKSDFFAHVTLKKTERSKVAEYASSLLI